MILISTLRAKAASLFQWLGILNKTRTLVDTFPGVDDRELLRQWVKSNAEAFQPFALKTQTPVDDMILSAIRRIANSEKAFAALYGVLRVTWEWVPVAQAEPVFGVFMQACVTEDCQELINGDETVENPLVVLSAIALLLQVIAFIRARRGKT
jgi:hypothetical protein